MRHDQQAVPVRDADRNVPHFIVRVVGVRVGDCQGITKEGCRLDECDPVFCHIRSRFPDIPLELHITSIPCPAVAPTLLPGGAVNRLAQGVGVAVMARVLLDAELRPSPRLQHHRHLQVIPQAVERQPGHAHQQRRVGGQLGVGLERRLPLPVDLRQEAPLVLAPRAPAPVPRAPPPRPGFRRPPRRRPAASNIPAPRAGAAPSGSPHPGSSPRRPA